MKSPLITLMASFAATILGAPTTNGTAHERRGVTNPDYQWVCNSFTTLELPAMKYCADYLHNDIPDKECGHDPKGPYGNGHMCSQSHVGVSALSYNGKKQYVKCRDAAEAIGFLMQRCGQQGGSASAKGNDNLIIHVSAGWVD